MSKIVFITGATSGIGEACAHKFAEAGYSIIINGRRKERLSNLESQLKNQYNIKVKSLTFDVRDNNEVCDAIDTIIGTEWENIDILLNNAGLSLGLNPINEGLLEDWDNMIDTNVKGLLYVSKKIMPLMVERKKGHIINIGSIAGKEVYLKGNVYCASKHAVDAISKAMRVDLLQHGIKVTQICPGAAETEFSIVRFKGNKEAADKVYEGFKPLTGEDIASIVLFASQLPPHVNINDLLVVPAAQAAASIINKDI
ncbi:MAG: SDR family NAD(P)-dependent oxidoreductase [Bacteroidetes bacterium]|nr:SDR family NAD(P)-dependent oxidoreductase [Bacteroidota bacterium]